MRDRETIVEPQLTEEQEAILQGGLRILARMIVRAHLASLREQSAQDNGSDDGTGGTSVTEAESPAKEDERVR